MCLMKFSFMIIKGTTAVSGSDDKTLIVWETKRGLALTSLQLHVPFIRFDISMECSRILVHLTDSPSFPIICLHNSPAAYIKLPTYSAPARDVEGKLKNLYFQQKCIIALFHFIIWRHRVLHHSSSLVVALRLVPKTL